MSTTILPSNLKENENYVITMHDNDDGDEQQPGQQRVVKVIKRVEVPRTHDDKGEVPEHIFYQAKILDEYLKPARTWFSFKDSNVSDVKVHTFENPELEGNIITTNGKWRCPRDDLTLDELAQKLTFDGVKQNSGKLWRLNRSISRKGAITLGKIITLQRELKGCESVTLQAAYSFRQLAAMYTD